MVTTSLSETERRVRWAVAAGAALIGAVVVVLLADQAAGGIGPLGVAAHRWGSALCGAGAAALTALRAATLQRDRRAWAPLALGLGLFAAGSTLWAALWSGDPHAPLPSVADLLWLPFYPALYATIAMVLRRSFVRAPASMWLDGLVAVLTFAAAGIAVIYGPVFHDAVRSDLDVGMQAVYPVSDLAFVVLVLAIVAASGWRPGARWLLIGGAMLSWFVADTVNLNAMAAGRAMPHGVADVFWTAGLAMLAAAPWVAPTALEGLRIEGARVLWVPAGFRAVALGLLAADRLAGLNDITGGLALGPVAVPLARPARTRREVQLLPDPRHESLVDELTGLPSRRH